MGFYSPAVAGRRRPPARRRRCAARDINAQPGAHGRRCEPLDRRPDRRARRSRLGLGRRCAGVGTELAEQHRGPRAAGGRTLDLADLVAAGAGCSPPQLEALATAGAFGCFGLHRREALWAAGRGRRCATAGPAARHGRRRRAPTLPGDDRRRADRRRPVGHRHLARAATRPSTCAPCSTRWAWCPPSRCAARPGTPGAASAASSPTGSGPATAGGSRSSTSRTRPAWST